MATSGAERIKDYRERMRKAGFRLVQMWVPDLDHPKFRAKLAKELAEIRKNKKAEKELNDFAMAAQDWDI